MKISRNCLLWAGIALAPIGCGGGSILSGSQPVYGEVTLDGRPVEAAQITFTPEAGGAPIQAKVEQGRYQILEGGPAPGRYKVGVTKAADAPAAAKAIPDRYRPETTTLIADIGTSQQAGQDFDLTSK